MTNACAKMATLADEIAAAHPRWSGRELLAEMALQVAGIHRGPGALLGLLTGGRSRLRGGGFRGELRDHSAEQTRHFIGVARAVTIIGPTATRWLSENLRQDPANSPDGKLTGLALEFSSVLLSGDVVTSAAGDWIRRNVCA